MCLKTLFANHSYRRVGSLLWRVQPFFRFRLTPCPIRINFAGIAYTLPHTFLLRRRRIFLQHCRHFTSGIRRKFFFSIDLQRDILSKRFVIRVRSYHTFDILCCNYRTAICDYRKTKSIMTEDKCPASTEPSLYFVAQVYHKIWP